MAHTNFEKGYVQIYTGNGKGKTTAAIGLSVRAISRNMRVFFGQFMKNTYSAEQKIFADYPENIVLKQFGTGQFVRGKPSEEDFMRAEAGWMTCKAAIESGEYDLVVMDELNVVLSLGLLPIEDVLRTVNGKAPQLEIVITGRNAPEALIEAAQLVTEMREIKHYYKIGVPARKGIEE